MKAKFFLIPKQRLLKYVFALLALLFVQKLALSQNGFGKLNEHSLKKEVSFTTTQYSTKEGLLQSQIVSIIENSEGALFLSTANGISFFNGSEFRGLETDKRYRECFFKDLYWSDKYKILFGRDYNSSLITQLLPTFGKKGNPALKFAAFTSQNDSLFLADQNGDLYTGTLPDFAIAKLGCRIPYTVNFLYYHAQKVYCTTSAGLYVYDLKTKSLARISEQSFVRVKVNPYSGKLYGITCSQLYIYDKTFIPLLDIHSSSEIEICQDLEFVNDAEVYLATTKGLYYYNPEYTEHYDATDGLSSSGLYCLHYNKDENCLFVGTGEKGLLKLLFKNAYSIYKREGFTPSSLNSIIKTTDGKVLVSENCCYIRHLRIDTVARYNEIQGSYSSLSEIDGKLFCGTWGGGLVVTKDNNVLYNLRKPRLPDDIVLASFKDSHGTIWIGTSAGIASGKGIEAIAPIFPDSIKTHINCFYELRNGDICAGGKDGFYIISGKKIIQHLSRANGLNTREVRSFLEDKEGKLWIGTYGGGIYCYDKGKLTSINAMKNCMLYEDAFCLAPDDKGQIFMTSNYGLWRVAFSKLDDFYKGKIDFLVPEQFTQENGILNTEFNGGFQNNYLKTRSNHFYFPTIEGVVVASSDENRVRKLKPNIDLIKGENLDTTKCSPTFQRNTPLIMFKVGCVNYSSKNNVYFQYKLQMDQASAEWSRPQKENLFPFYQLPPAKYTFVIRAIDGGNDPKPIEATYTFVILPYFYETLWFKIVFGLFVFILAVLIIRLRIRKHKEVLEKENKIKRELAELQLEGIQAQMNPHFVFNCLNTIQSLFITGQTKLANEYTSRFSSLMRLIIEHIRKRKVTIREEIEMLEIYLPLENFQLENNFEYTIQVESGIDKEATIIHGMILHTFVENAIKHGLKPLTNRKGILSIEFKKATNAIVVEIKDNGAGIKQTSGKSKASKHVSRGLQIIQERIQLINSLEHINIYVETIDRSDINKNETGTLVKINYPIL